jgi:hypothetical protein
MRAAEVIDRQASRIRPLPQTAHLNGPAQLTAGLPGRPNKLPIGADPSALLGYGPTSTEVLQLGRSRNARVVDQAAWRPHDIDVVTVAIMPTEGSQAPYSSRRWEPFSSSSSLNNAPLRHPVRPTIFTTAAVRQRYSKLRVSCRTSVFQQMTSKKAFSCNPDK